MKLIQRSLQPLRNRFGIRSRLTLTYLAIILVAMGLSGFLLLSLLESYFLQAVRASLLAQAQITAQALTPGMPVVAPAQNAASNTLQQQQLGNYALSAQNNADPNSSAGIVPGSDLSYLANTSLQLSSQLETRIRILDVSGNVVVDSCASASGESFLADQLISEAQAGRAASQIVSEGTGAVMQLALPWQAGGRLVGVIVLSQPLRDVTAVLYDLRLRWLLATALALVVSACISLLLSRALTKPLQQLTTAVTAVAHGNLESQVPVRSADELGQLSAGFNEMTSRLRAARQAQVDLVANVSHELRTPLTTIKGMVETLRSGAADDPPVRDRFLLAVDHETDRMVRLVNDLLLLSRADSSALDLQPAALNMVSVVADMLERLRSLAEKKGVTLSFEPSAEELLVWADRDRVEQILANLLDNAVKYSRPGGHVTLTLKREGKLAATIITNQGEAIPADALEHLGERFYRTEKARSREGGGSGLGLAIARALTEAHGGSLSISSQPELGVIVTFTLPLA